MIECRLIKSLTSFSLILLCLIYGCGIFAADGNVKVGIAAKATRVEPVITINARPFDLMQVRLLDDPFKNAMELERKYLLSLDEERLLHNFRVNAGLPSSARPLGGAELRVERTFCRAFPEFEMRDSKGKWDVMNEPT